MLIVSLRTLFLYFVLERQSAYMGFEAFHGVCTAGWYTAVYGLYGLSTHCLVFTVLGSSRCISMLRGIAH
jgi:hypothetical protein